MRVVKFIFGILLGFFALVTMIQMGSEERGAGLIGALTGFVIVEIIAIYLVYNAYASHSKEKLKTANSEIESDQSYSAIDPNNRDSIDTPRDSNSHNDSESNENSIQFDMDKEILILTENLERLNKLYQKGILSKEEYELKCSKINLAKANLEFQKSREYIDLQALFNQKVLSQEEFENKSKLLLNRHIQNINVPVNRNRNIIPLVITGILIIIYPFIIKYFFKNFFEYKVYNDELKLFFWISAGTALLMIKKQSYMSIVLFIMAVLYCLIVSSQHILDLTT